MDYKILLVFISALVLTTACERNASGDKSKLSIRFPDVSQSSSSNKSVSAMAVNGSSSSDEWASVTPTGLSGNYPINCFGVYIGGPETELRDNICSRSDTGAAVRTFGMWKGGVAAGTALDFEVPSGKDRVVGIFGFHATSAAACKDITGTAEMDKSQLSKPYIIGEVGRQEFLPGKTVEVSVPLSFDSSLWFDDCKGPDFQNNSGGGGGTSTPSHAYFGNGMDGDVTLTSGLSELRNIIGVKGVALSTSSRVTGLATTGGDKKKLELMLYSSAVGKFAVGDEVMVYVAASAGATACGPSVVTGFRTRGIVTNVSASVIYLDTDDERFGDIPSASLGESVPAYGPGRDFCRLVATRVANIDNLTFTNNANVFFNAYTFGDMTTSSNHEAGLMFVRVKQNLVMQSDGGLDVAGRGFSGGNYSQAVTISSVTYYPPGQSSIGAFVPDGSSAPNGTGGGGALGSPNAPAGGGHGGMGGSGANGVVPPGNIQGDEMGCSVLDNSMKCLFGKLFMGGGGGAGYDANGGYGGGIIELSAKSVQLNSYTLTLNAEGTGAFNGSTMGGGAGAGGTVLMHANTITSSVGGALKIRSNGGISKTNSGLQNSSGGTGGGGRNHLEVTGACSVLPGAISMESYSPSQYIGSAGLGGTNGTNYVSGAGLNSCDSFITKNTSPFIAKVSPYNTPVSTSITVYGEGLTNIASAKLQLGIAPYTEYNCSITAPTAKSFVCNVTTGTGQYHVIVTTSSGQKTIMNSAVSFY